jgi:hypothetical protein
VSEHTAEPGDSTHEAIEKLHQDPENGRLWRAQTGDNMETCSRQNSVTFAALFSYIWFK